MQAEFLKIRRDRTGVVLNALARRLVRSGKDSPVFKNAFAAYLQRKFGPYDTTRVPQPVRATQVKLTSLRYGENDPWYRGTAATVAEGSFPQNSQVVSHGGEMLEFELTALCRFRVYVWSIARLLVYSKAGTHFLAPVTLWSCAVVVTVWKLAKSISELL